MEEKMLNDLSNNIMKWANTSLPPEKRLELITIITSYLSKLYEDRVLVEKMVLQNELRRYFGGLQIFKA